MLMKQIPLEFYAKVMNLLAGQYCSVIEKEDGKKKVKKIMKN